MLTFAFDLIIFSRRQKQITEHVEGLNQQISLAREQKKKQQLRANEVSDHSDKLKSFISDKLIEYMDFDEKFIHFKGIASEVRHNGVISYDKINSALNKAIEQQNYLAIYEQNSQSDNAQDEAIDSSGEISSTNSILHDYQTAKDAIAYLWDLLDLSTAENMSLYIGKKLVDYEEMYYQTQLNPTQHDDLSSSFGVNPTFYPLQSVLMTMRLFSNQDKLVHLLANSKINEKLLASPFQFDDEQFVIKSNPTARILGNPNHLVLLLENLIKNAQFFSGKSRYKQSSDRVIIRLGQKTLTVEDEEETAANISIYNRGKPIESDDMEHIFKLGYTTRRKSNVNGRGLGLYFVNQIVKGYQGAIDAVNIQNEACEYKLTIALASDEVLEFFLQTTDIDGRVLLSSGAGDPLKEFKLENEIPIKSINLSKANETVLSDQQIEPRQSYQWQDEQYSWAPGWCLSLSVFKKKHLLIFKGLDIAGVRFDISLPLVDE